MEKKVNKRIRGSRPYFKVRVGSDLKRLVESAYKAKVLLRKDKGVEGKYSMNDFIEGILWDQG